MPVVHRKVFVKAPPEMVDQWLVDPKYSSEIWDADKAEPEGNWPEKGGKLHTTTRIAGVPLKSTITVLEHVPGQRHSQQVDGMMTAKMEWTLTPENDGTVVETNMDYQAPAGALGPALDKLMFERAVNSLADKVAKALYLHGERSSTSAT